MKAALDKLAELEATDAKAANATRELIEALKCVVETWERGVGPMAMNNAIAVARGALKTAGVELPQPEHDGSVLRFIDGILP